MKECNHYWQEAVWKPGVVNCLLCGQRRESKLGIKKAREWFKENLGPAFVFFEAAMHVYLVIYLSFNWTNLLVWGFTVFELTMFIYLLVKRHYQKTHHKKWP